MSPLKFALLVLLLSLCAIVDASAHDSWISSNQWRNSAGQWCCGKGDCGVVLEPEKAIETGPDGYHIDGKVQLDGADDAGNVSANTFGVQAHIPYANKLPSPDGHYWYCKSWNNEPRCFFAPTPTY